MKEYLSAGVALIMISLGNFAYVVARVWLYGKDSFVARDTVLSWLLQCSASLLCGAVGGYLLAIHRERQEASNKQPLPQGSSVQE